MFTWVTKITLLLKDPVLLDFHLPMQRQAEKYKYVVQKKMFEEGLLFL